jgi:hypothetical protein
MRLGFAFPRIDGKEKQAVRFQSRWGYLMPAKGGGLYCHASIRYRRRLLTALRGLFRKKGNPTHRYCGHNLTEKATWAAPGWKVYFLEREGREESAEKALPHNHEIAFFGFCKKIYRGKDTPSPKTPQFK